MNTLSSVTWDLFFHAAYCVLHENLPDPAQFTAFTRLAFIRASLDMVRIRYLTLCHQNAAPHIVTQAFHAFLVAVGEGMFTLDVFQDFRDALNHVLALPPQ